MNQVCLEVALGTSYIRLAKMHRTLGAYPIAGPVPHLTDDPLECRRLLEGQTPATRTWFHGTSENIAQLACVQGIAPGCWIGDGSGSCSVMGYDEQSDFLGRRGHLWIVEIVGPALDGDLKAWWVPPHDVRGVWHVDSFLPRDEITGAFRGRLSEPRMGCGCPLSDICHQQQALWRGTWARRRSA